jgi:dCMP deaminase
MLKTDEEYLLMAYQKATESPDPSTQNGAVIPIIVDKLDEDNNKHVSELVVVSACNTFPRGVAAAPERLERPIKYSYIEHAERGVIYQANYDGFTTRGLTLYCPWFACADCGRAIICNGITRVVGHKKMFDETPPHWKESIAHAFHMFREAGILTTLITGDLNGPEIRFNGQMWRP